MSAALITGMSGAGKSTIAVVLARRGLASLDADNDPKWSRFIADRFPDARYVADVAGGQGMLTQILGLWQGQVEGRGAGSG